jgi:adenine-specific DNA methylase
MSEENTNEQQQEETRQEKIKKLRAQLDKLEAMANVEEEATEKMEAALLGKAPSKGAKTWAQWMAFKKENERAYQAASARGDVARDLEILGRQKFYNKGDK